MAKILHIVSSPRGNQSFSRQLGNAIIDSIKKREPDTTVKEHVLSENPYPHLGEAHITGFYTPEENRTPEQAIAVKRSDDAIAELQGAEIIVIGVPMYNFSIPSSLKAYFDHVARAGITFRYSEKGPEGLLKNKKAYIALSSAGVFDNDAMRPYDFAAPYVKQFLDFIGITDVTVFRVEGTAIPGIQETAMEKALENVNAYFGR